MMSKHPVGEQRASKVKFLKWFSPPALACRAARPAREKPAASWTTAALHVGPSYLPGKERGAIKSPPESGPCDQRGCTPRARARALWPRKGARQATGAPGCAGWGWGWALCSRPVVYAPLLRICPSSGMGPSSPRGTVCIFNEKASRKQHQNPSVPFSLPCAPPHLRPPTPDKTTPGCVVMRPLLGA